MPRRTGFALVVAAGALVLQSAVAAGQAWVPSARQVSIGFGYQYLDVGDHLMSADVPPELGGDGTKRWDLGKIDSQSMFINLDFGVTDRLAASAGVAYVASRYRGFDPESDIDDGTWNQGVQDFGLGLRYMAIRAPIVVTPSLQVTLPSHSYTVVGHASIGRDLNLVRLGLNVGWAGRTFLPGLYVQGSYKYSITEKIEGVRPNQSDVALEAGYFLSENLVLWTTGEYAYVHEGLDWLTDYDDHVHVHDQLAKKVATTAGGGLGYSFGPTTVGLGVITTLGGENTHDATAYMINVGRTFSLPR